MDMTSKVSSILEKVKYATLATTCEDGNPWNSPVFCAYDEEFNIYWSSTLDAVHSANVLRSGKVFLVVYDSSSDTGEGVYMQSRAVVLEDEFEIRKALDLLGKRRGHPFKHTEKFISGPQRIFKATPDKIWLNDADKDQDGDYIRDYRIEVKQ